MSARRQSGSTRRANFALEDNTGRQPQRPSTPPRWTGRLLYALLWAVLWLPRIRRWRRGPHWNRVRLAAGVAAAAGAGFGLASGPGWLAAAGLALGLAALLLRPARDPDAERKLQARLGADYFLNGGTFRSGPMPGGNLPPGTPLYLLIRRDELLIVPQRSGEIHSVTGIAAIGAVHVNGEPYRPVYVSEAKDPPVRETAVDKSATSVLELVLDSGEALRFEYQGAFSKHLAETAAHAVYSVRRLRAADGVSGETPEVFHIVGGQNISK